jgi:hypothetical protein
MSSGFLFSIHRWRVGVAVAIAVIAMAAMPISAQQKLRGAAAAAAIDRQVVVPGTALDQLIHENQDATMELAPPQDDLVVPLWLRALWRKNHPESRIADLTVDLSDPDPTGGYPLVLKEIWEWMLTHQDLQPGPPEPDSGPGPKIATVAGNLRTSGAQTSPRSESHIRVNPRNPMQIIAGSNNIQGSGKQAQFTSTDGGATWTQSYLPLATGDSFHSDPTVEWTSDGTAWATTIGIDAAGTILKMRAYKSTDQGSTWTFDSTFSDQQTSTDKQMTWVDSSPISPHRDNIYAIWHNNKPVFMNRRTSAGWQTPIQVSGAETTGTGIGSDVRTNSAGEIYGFWPDTGSRKLLMVKSTNGGASYGSPVTVATTFDGYDIGVPAMNNRRVLIYTTGGAYKTSTTSFAFLAWNDLSGDTGCTSAANEPAASVTSTCKTRIWFSRSTNGGSTWSAPAKINNQTSKNDQFNPWMVVDETNGRIALIYYDTVADAGRKKTDVYYQSSADFGLTWSTAVKVSSAQTDETSTGTNLGNQYGDYNGLSGVGSQFFPSWTDRRGNAKEEIWTAGITDTGSTGPDPSIQPWGADRVPPTSPLWQTSDVWVDNDGDGIVNEANEPQREDANNILFARITNRGSTPASNYRVWFRFKPYTTNGSAPAGDIAFVDETGTLAAGASKNYSVSWDLTTAFLTAHFPSQYVGADHFCVQITVEPIPAVTLDDINPTNNFAQNNYGNVPVKEKKQGRAKFYLYNHLDRAAIAALETQNVPQGWRLQFTGIDDPRRIPIQPKQWLEVEAVVTAVGAPPPEPGRPATIDITQRLDGAIVGGLTLGLRPEEEFDTDPKPGPDPGSTGLQWYAGISSGLNRPFDAMARQYDPGPMFAAQLERDFYRRLRLGLQVGYHEFDGRQREPFFNQHLEVVNVTFYTRWRWTTGSVHPFIIGGLGAYNSRGHWDGGAQLGAGLEVPVTGKVSLMSGITVHHVNSSRVDLDWVDASIGMLFRLP